MIAALCIKEYLMELENLLYELEIEGIKNDSEASDRSYRDSRDSRVRSIIVAETAGTAGSGLSS
ncbi:MAG: hypothetical protein ACJAWL_001046 [Motiliproteus sp.]